ncbi:ABC transporter ATP-binding protein [Paenibacillus chartarius]|uniref:ABC transporter ATP-binding protein n=1 Tax=Paenibacillus chartarius TaxID=747481 RepID=A0ABV6DLK0_9BACL
MKLEVSNLIKRYKTPVLNGVSFQLQSGKIYCLLGRNGAGKTTLMKILSGSLPFDEGVVLFDGGKEFYREVVYVPETPVLLEYLTGYENLDFVSKLNHIPMEPAEMNEYIERSGLSSFIDKLAVSYSHGMKHQLALAIAQLLGPKVLLLDEPLVSLDPINIRLIREQLIHYARQGHIVLISTHMIPIASRISDEILILSEGTVFQSRNEFSEEELEAYVLNIMNVGL